MQQFKTGYCVSKCTITTCSFCDIHGVLATGDIRLVWIWNKNISVFTLQSGRSSVLFILLSVCVCVWVCIITEKFVLTMLAWAALQIQDRSPQLRPVVSERVCDWLRHTTGLDCGGRSWICNAPQKWLDLAKFDLWLRQPKLMAAHRVYAAMGLTVCHWIVTVISAVLVNCLSVKYSIKYKIAFLTFKAIHLQTPTSSTTISSPVNHHETFAYKTVIFSQLRLSALFQPRVLSVTRPQPSVIPFFLLSPHSLPSPLSNLLLKPTISNWRMLRNVLCQRLWIWSLGNIKVNWTILLCRSIGRVLISLPLAMSP